MDLGRTRGKIKRQRIHSKRDNVEKDFFGVETVKRPKKKGSVKMSKHKFSIKKSKGRQKKTQRNISPFSKKKTKSGNK